MLNTLEFAAGLAAPLMVRQQIIGVLLAGVQPGAAITEADQEFVTSFANQMAIALQNSRLYGQLETSERHYRGLVENAHEGIWIVEINGVIKFANRRMEEITGTGGFGREKPGGFLGRGKLPESGNDFAAK